MMFRFNTGEYSLSQISTLVNLVLGVMWNFFFSLWSQVLKRIRSTKNLILGFPCAIEQYSCCSELRQLSALFIFLLFEDTPHLDLW